MSKEMNGIMLLKKSLIDQVNFLNNNILYKKLSEVKMSDSAGTGDYIEDYENVLGVLDNGFDIDLEPLNGFVLDSYSDYINMIVEMVSKDGISRDVVLGIIDIMSFLNKNFGSEEYDVTSVSNVQNFCALYASSPMDFWDMVHAPVMAKIEELKRNEYGRLK